jgi:hypothetical protein
MYKIPRFAVNLKMLLPFFAALSISEPALSNTLGDTIQSNTEAETRFIERELGVDPHFMYCYMDITVFDDISTDNCRYTISSFNLLLNKVSAGKIPYDDKDLLLKILTQLRASRVSQNK